MIEVDLLDADSVIVSSAQADPDVWVNIAAQANAAATQAGFTIMTGPLIYSPERTLTSIADVHEWLSTQNIGGVARAGVASSAPIVGVVVGLALGGLLAGLLGAVVGGVAGWWGGKLASP
jgi:hypothetical protein